MRNRPSPLMWVVLVLILTAGMVGSTGCGSSAPSAPSAESSATATAGDVISWEQAGAHSGENVTVEGPVVAIFYDDTVERHPTFINMGTDYPDRSRCTVIVWEADLAAFPETPKSLYDGKTIRVSGEVIEYQKAPAIQVSSPGAIEVLD